MKSALILLVASALPFFAHADIELLNCASADRSTAVQVATHYVGTYESITPQGKEITGVVRFARLNGKNPGQNKTSLKGLINSTTKGPYSELATEGMSLEIAAPGTGDASLLVINGQKIALDCR